MQKGLWIGAEDDLTDRRFEMRFDRKTTMKLLLRFLNYNIVGLIVFPVCTAIFGVAYLLLNPWWGWIFGNFAGGIIHFGALQIANYKKSGSILLTKESNK